MQQPGQKRPPLRTIYMDTDCYNLPFQSLDQIKIIRQIPRIPSITLPHFHKHQFIFTRCNKAGLFPI